MTPGLQINTFNRPEYLAECLASLKAADLRGCKVIIVDDCSTDRETHRLIKESGFKTYSTARNGGIKESLKLGYAKLIEAGCDVLINLDGDAVVKPDFLKVLLKLKEETWNIVCGFNVDSKVNPVRGEGKGYVLKRHCNGICSPYHHRDSDGRWKIFFDQWHQALVYQRPDRGFDRCHGRDPA